VRWIIDGNNVMGSRPDGWWRDRAGAALRLAAQVDRWQRTHGDPVTLFFDGRPDAAVVGLTRPGLEVRFAPGRRRDAADDAIVAESHAPSPTTSATPDDLTVVTSDRALRHRLPADATTLGSRTFLTLLDQSA